jgi:hypothetical protein
LRSNETTALAVVAGMGGGHIYWGLNSKSETIKKTTALWSVHAPTIQFWCVSKGIYTSMSEHHWSFTYEFSNSALMIHFFQTMLQTCSDMFKHESILFITRSKILFVLRWEEGKGRG